ncbi:hypothetical protein [Alishewanella longhuensis]
MGILAHPFSHLQFKDNGLKQCVLYAVTGITSRSAEQVTSLFCSGVVDAAGIEQLLFLKYLGLTGAFDADITSKRLVNFTPITKLENSNGAFSCFKSTNR